jgi:hypothetical protein
LSRQTIEDFYSVEVYGVDIGIGTKEMIAGVVAAASLIGLVVNRKIDEVQVILILGALG